jgi:hypothetical protein
MLDPHDAGRAFDRGVGEAVLRIAHDRRKTVKNGTFRPRLKPVLLAGFERAGGADREHLLAASRVDRRFAGNQARFCERMGG